MDRVAERAGASTASIYNRWPNRTALLLATFEHVADMGQPPVPTPWRPARAADFDPSGHRPRVASPAAAIKGGVPDAGAHPFVGQLLFYDPTETDPRFNDPGAWFNCSGTLVSPTVVVTAGHCTFGTGTDGEPTSGGSGGNDVWISFAEVPDYSILPPSSGFVPDGNDARYEAWSSTLNASDEWICATAFPHPQFDANAFVGHDLGVLVLDEPVNLGEYGQLPTEGLLDRLYAERKQQTYTAVGYGLEGSGPKTAIGGDTRRRAELQLVNLNGVRGFGKGTSAKFSSNANTGGTCFGTPEDRSSSPGRTP